MGVVTEGMQVCIQYMCVDYCGMLFSNIVSPVKLSQNDLTKLIVKYRTYAHSWREIGQNLGFNDDELKNIEARPNLHATAPKSYLSAMLSDWWHWAPGDARGSTNYATLDSLKTALDQAGLGQL